MNIFQLNACINNNVVGLQKADTIMIYPIMFA